jgi:hypothetical protein
VVLRFGAGRAAVPVAASPGNDFSHRKYESPFRKCESATCEKSQKKPHIEKNNVAIEYFWKMFLNSREQIS